MRVSTGMLQQQGIDALLARQAALAKTQQQVASGRRLTSPADDPVAAQQILQLNRALSQLGQFERNADVAESRLGLEDNALRGVNDVLQRARELVLTGSNATQNSASRAALATEVRQLNAALLQLANSQDGQGEYLFGGYARTAQPFTGNGGAVTYHGDQGQRFLQVAPHRSIADGDSGAEVFQLIRDGNGTFAARPDVANAGTGIVLPAGVTDPTAYDRGTYTIEFTTATDYQVLDAGGGIVTAGTYTPGAAIGFQGIAVSVDGTPAVGDRFDVTPSAHQDLFTTLEGVATALESGGNDPVGQARLSNALNDGLLALDQGIGRITSIRIEIGARLNSIDAERAANEALDVQLRSTLSAIEDLDLVEAVGRLALELTGLEAAQRVFSEVQSLSLFDYL